MENRISMIESLVKEELNGLCTAHDFEHIDRVRNMSVSIAKKEWANKEISEAWALLHEYFDEKFYEPEQIASREQLLSDSLQKFGYNQEQIEKIIFIAKHVWFGKSLKRATDFPYTLEMQVVEDADRLEAIGAIAIARTFTFGGKRNRKLYDGRKLEAKLPTKDSYRSTIDSTSLEHFYEKLLLLKDMMHTKTATKIAQSRHDFMQSYLDQFYREWYLEDVE